MKSIKQQVIEAYDKHYVSSCSDVVDLTLEKVEKIIDDNLENGILLSCERRILTKLKLSLKGGKK